MIAERIIMWIIKVTSIACRPDLLCVRRSLRTTKAIPMPKRDLDINRVSRRKIKDLKNKLTYENEPQVNVGYRRRKQGYLPPTTGASSVSLVRIPANHTALPKGRCVSFYTPPVSGWTLPSRPTSLREFSGDTVKRGSAGGISRRDFSSRMAQRLLKDNRAERVTMSHCTGLSLN